MITTAHPQISFLRLVDRRDLPADFVEDIERWKTRSGTVKINVAVDRLPEFASKPGFDPEVHGGTIVLADSLDEIEASYQEAVTGKPATRPFADICIPSVFDDSLAPEGHHVVSMFTQWVPHTWNLEPHTAELDAYADRMVARMDEVAPGSPTPCCTARSSGRTRWSTSTAWSAATSSTASCRRVRCSTPARPPGYADLRTPIAGSLPGRLRHPRRRRRDRGPRTQRRPSGAERPQEGRLARTVPGPKNVTGRQTALPRHHYVDPRRSDASASSCCWTAGRASAGSTCWGSRTRAPGSPCRAGWPSSTCTASRPS